MPLLLLSKPDPLRWAPVWFWVLTWKQWIFKVCNAVKGKKRESILTNQWIRSGTGIGANIRETFYAHGRADFIAKLQIGLKECAEREYWLE